MSANKSKYFVVTTTRVVQANNKTDALAAVNRRKSTAPGRVLTTWNSAERVPAAYAHQVVAEIS